MMSEQMQTELYTPTLTGKAHIRIIDSQRSLTVRQVTNGMTIGRALPGNNVICPISGRFLSRRHGCFLAINGQYYYEDLNSTNGTYINDIYYGQSIDRKGTCTNKKALQNGDIIRIGSSQNVQAGSEPVIIIFGLEDIREETWGSIDLTNMDHEICIGRDRNMSSTVLSAYVSRKHATFFRAGSKMAIKDHKSTNGVYLNNKRIEKPCYLYYGDCIRLADHYFIYLDNSLYYSMKPMKERAEQAVPHAEPSASPYSDPYGESSASPYADPHAEHYGLPQAVSSCMQFHENKKVSIGPNLSIYIEERTVFSRFKKYTLLKDIHMTIENGDMVLILGGSGAGKTTFMNAVMGYEKAKGKITHGDKDLYEDYNEVKYDIGFVPQQDLLRLTDTVYNVLHSAAVMKMPASTKKDALQQRVEEVMEMLGLTRERDSLVQKLSGGQKKRLSIAVELISNPSLFFLDEPDSGLDGIMARTLMENLRTIADQGKIVMVITHGPDRAVDLFDKVIVLAKSVEDNCGHLAFYGSVPEAFSFFECDTLEGIVRRINRKDEGGDGLSDTYIRKYAEMTGIAE